MWREGRASELMDEKIGNNSRSASEVLRCIQISLLCVQQRPEDRPTMSSVVQMLGSSEAPCPSLRSRDSSWQRSETSHMTSTLLQPLMNCLRLMKLPSHYCTLVEDIYVLPFITICTIICTHKPLFFFFLSFSLFIQSILTRK